MSEKYELKEELEERNRKARTRLLTLSQGPDSLNCPVNTYLDYIAKAYSEGYAKKVTFTSSLLGLIDYIEQQVGATVHDEESGKFIFTETDTRQLKKAIDIFKTQIESELIQLTQQIKDDLKQRGINQVLSESLDIITGVLKKINEKLPSIELILSAQPGFAES